MGNNLSQLIKLRLDTQKINKPREMADLEDACWEGYEPIGTKELDGRTVPNCVPIKDEQSKIKKEGFPIPSPENNEERDMYVSRCVSSIADEYGQEQSLAICISKYENK